MESKLKNSPEEENKFLNEKAPRFLDGLESILGDKNFLSNQNKVRKRAILTVI